MIRLVKEDMTLKLIKRLRENFRMQFQQLHETNQQLAKNARSSNRGKVNRFFVITVLNS